jgi:glycosyltransferase involved in cell wall biosynthesis
MHHNIIKVSHIIPQIGIGGAELQLYHLITHSNSLNIQHTVLYYSDSGDLEGIKLYEDAKIDLQRIPRNKKSNFLYNLTHRIKKTNPDIVHCWLYSANIWGRWAAIWASLKNIIVTYRSSSLRRTGILRILEMFSTRKVHYLANSKACANAIANQLHLRPDKFKVIYNGLDYSSFELNIDGNKFLTDLNIPVQSNVITMVGRLTPSKNHHMLLKIVQRCKSEDIPICCLIVGHGESEQELKKTAIELEIEKRVRFLGLRKDIPAILKCSDIFCFTTIFEGFPNALLEAMAAGLPIVTTDFAGVHELIEDGYNGKIVPINDVEQAFQALKFYLQNPSIAENYAQKAKEDAIKRFSMDTMVQCTLDLYKNILENNQDVVD